MKVTGEGRIKESITRKRQASSIASVGSTCGLNLKIPGQYRSQTEVVTEWSNNFPCNLTGIVLPGYRKLVSDGFCSGEADQDIHTQQPHIHPH